MNAEELAQANRDEHLRRQAFHARLEHCGAPCCPSRAMVMRELEAVYAPEAVSEWWAAANAHLGGRTPDAAWEAGDRQAVYDLARAFRVRLPRRSL